MPESRARDLATSLGQAVATDNITSAGGLAVVGLNTYTNVSNLPSGYDSTNAGSLAFVTDSDKLYIHTGQGWFNIAIINTNPIWVTQPDASYALNTDATAYLNGTATTITLVARDSEGQEIQWSTETDAGFDNMAYISQSVPSTNYDNDSAVFTIEPMSEDSATATSGSVTFKASDGVNVITASASFTLEFATAVNNSAETKLLLKASGNAGTNTTINDATGTNSITPTNDPVAQAFTPFHPRGYSFEVVGNTDAVAIDSGYFTTNTSWWTSSGFTVEGWVNISSADNSAIFDNRQSSTTGFMINRNYASNKISIYADGAWAGSFSSDLSLNEWHYIALVFSGTSANLYTDGVKDATTLTVANTATYGYFGRGKNTLGGVQHTPRQSNGLEGLYRDFKFTAGVEYTGATMTVPTSRKNSDSNTALFVTMSPYLRDLSSNASTVTTIGSTLKFVADTPYDHVKYNVSAHGASVYFDGTGDYLSVADNNSLDFGTGDWTIECWLYKTGSFSNYDTPWSKYVSSAGYYLHITSTGAFLFGTSNSNYATSTQVMKLNTWHHVAVVRNSDTIKVYLDGAATSISMSYSGDNDNSAAFAIGDMPGLSREFQGYISDFRVVKGTAVYTGDFTPAVGLLTTTGGTYLNNTNRTDPTSSATSLLTCNDTANIYNASGQDSVPVTLSGNTQSSTAVTKYASSNMLFDGSGDYLEAPFLISGTGDYTMEFWFYPKTIDSNFKAMTDPRSGDADNPLLWIRNNNTLYYYSGGSNTVLGTTTLQANTWYHAAISRQNGIAYLYLNGSLEGSAADTADFGTGTLRVGQRYTSTAYNFDGHIEDLRITEGVARYPFTPPSETVSDTTETKLIACHHSTVTTDGTGTHTITAAGDTTSSDTAPHSGMKSTYFDGNGDYLEVDNSTEFQHSTNDDLSIDFWMYWTGGSGTRNVVDNRGNANGYAFQLLSNNTLGIYSEPASGYVHTSSTLQSYKWYHIVYSRVSGTSYMFVNGTLVNAGVSDTNNYTSQSIVIGARHSKNQQYYTGYVSNFRVVQNASLFPNSFTPPTELTA